MTSSQSLLYAAEADVTIDRIRALVRQVGPESPTVEYKQQMTGTIARGVAALANTYGGLLLVGVSDDRIVRGVKVEAIEAVAEHCHSKIEPPWVPEIIPVPLGQGSDLYVLVLRVLPGHRHRPLLVDGVAYVRHQNTSHPASWQQLHDLFAEGGAAGDQDDFWSLRRPDMPLGPDGGSDEGVDFVMRSGLGVPISRAAKWRPLSEATVTALINGLNSSPLDATLTDLAVGSTRSGGHGHFRRRGLNRSRTIRLEWSSAPVDWPSGLSGPVEACARLMVPGGYGDVATHMQVEIDVLVRFSARTQGAHERPTSDELGHDRNSWRVTARQLRELLDAMLATLVMREVVSLLADLAGIDPVAVPQPRALHLLTQRPITEVIDMTGLQPIVDAGVSRGTHLLADPALDLAADGDRQTQVIAWLIQAAQDAGLLGMEQVLRQLTPRTCSDQAR